MAKLKYYARKIRYAKKLKERWRIPLWVILRKYGRIVHPWRIKQKRDWRRKKIGL